jgi:hypothetical protein
MHHYFPGESNRHDPTRSVARSARPCTPCEGLTISGGVSVPIVRLSRAALVRPSIRAVQFHAPGASPWTSVVKRFTQVSAIIAVIVSLGACAEFSDYKPAPGEPLASIALSPEMAKETLTMCKTLHDCHELPPSYGVILVPANQRISLYRKFQRSANARTQFCSAGISFEPKLDQHYFAAFMIIGNRCMFRIYRWSPKNGRPQPFQFGSPALDLAAYATLDPTMGKPLPLYNN